MSLERLLVVSDALAKSVVLGRDESEVANVFDTIEPFARELATSGQTSKSRTDLLKLLGNSLLVQHRVVRPRRGRREAGRAVGPARPRAALCAAGGRI